MSDLCHACYMLRLLSNISQLGRGCWCSYCH